MKSYILFILMFLCIHVNTQSTVGVLHLDEEASDGYIFFSPFSGTKAYLIDNCGNLINEWDRGTRPGLSAYFLENGFMLRTYKLSPVGPFTSASNAGGLELVDWNNNTVWKYEINNPEQLSHHDAIMIPGGNILVLTWELTYRDQLIELGRDPDRIAVENYMWSEKILELEPIGSDSAKIVWQWHINDHYIQDLDTTKQGFGVISEHPELFDINQPDLNSGNSNATRDWNHFNAIDYNPELDQILLSVRNSDEIWILDHSTSTEEAAGHSGGRYGKGGDILYRWGNPSAYKSAPISEQKLWGQHGTHWIEQGLENAGDIMIFNNGNGRPMNEISQVQILKPPQDSLGFYSQVLENGFGPSLAITVYGDQSSEFFYSPYLSNAQRLSNGNTLINPGSTGRIFEITESRGLVWEYEIPLFGDLPATQGQAIFNNSTFRAYKYSSDYIGFNGLDLSPGEPIEIDPNECELISKSSEVLHKPETLLFNAEHDRININSDLNDIKQIEIYDMQGRLLERIHSIQNTIELPESLTLGIYIIKFLYKNGEFKTYKILLS